MARRVAFPDTPGQQRLVVPDPALDRAGARRQHRQPANRGRVRMAEREQDQIARLHAVLELAACIEIELAIERRPV